MISNENLLHVYNRFEVEFAHAKGMYLYDVNEKPYLDFGSGIGVMAFGYCDEEYTKALTDQINRILHTSNLYYHDKLALAAKAVCDVTGMDKAFFTNSGAEAIEGSIKAAKKYAYNKEPKDSYEIISFDSSFHGRTVGALSVTGTEHYREPFLPLMSGVKFATFNDYESAQALVNDNTCAIIVEPVQGEGGIVPATKEFLTKLRKLCDERDIVLIFDEIQCGLGRTGDMYAWMGYGIKPDIITSAKALGGGVPVGAFAVTEKIANSSLVPGDHGTTYGGNPFVCAAVIKSIEIIKDRKLPEHVKEMEPYFESILDEFIDKYSFVKSKRGVGFMRGLALDTSVPVGEIVKSALDEGLVILSAQGNVIRFLPPLIAEKNDFDKMKEILDKILAAR